MSRTDVHRPWLVQVNDPYNRYRLYRFASWPWQMDLMPLYNTCGCPLCTGAPWNRARRRGERHEWRKVRNELLKSQDWDGGWFMKYRSGGW
jgi:hypothetical protein